MNTEHSPWKHAPLPTLFVPHGAPTFALEPGEAGAVMATLAQTLPRPAAILVVTPHWLTAQPILGGALHPETVHDYSGFPRKLYSLRYPASGDYCIASAARDLLQDAGLAAGIDLTRGLDHGAWIPLRLMYPQADVPVIPLSVQPRLGASHHFNIGRALAPLRRRGVLILASGNLTHNLGHFMAGNVDNDYVSVFSEWMEGRLAAGDTEALLDYRARAPGARDAHPTEEHLLPLYVALGAAGEQAASERLFSGVYDRHIAMDSFVFRSPQDAAAVRQTPMETTT